MKQLRCKLWAKVTAVLLLYILAATWVLCGVGVIALAQQDAYFDGGTSLRTEVTDSGAYYYRAYLYQHLEAMTYPDLFYLDTQEFNDRFAKERCNYFFTVTDSEGNMLLQNYTDPKPLRTYQHDFEFSATYQNEHDVSIESAPPISYTVHAGVAGDLHAKDRIYYYITYTELLIRARYLLAVGVVLLPLAMIVILIFLCCAAGRHEHSPHIRPNAIDRIPLDVLLAVMVGASLGAAFIAGELFYGADTEWFGLIAAWIPLSLMMLLTMATRIKCRTLLSNTVIWRLGVLLGRLCRLTVRVLGKLPLYWKTALIWTGYSLTQLFFMLLWDDAEYLLLWIPEKLLGTPLIVWAVIQLQMLRHAGEELANGHIDHHVSTRFMFPAFKAHGEHLNHIGDGMQIAMEESLKSERMRMELISNVSHDIKTPLTSIINYVDLLKTEGLQSEQASAYLDVLERQSWRLKKLTEDVIEASKASTGHIAVQRTALDSTILLQQALAEYEDRLQVRQLEAVVRQSAPTLPISADGRLLWRIFDNLLNNIVKYAKSDTRVYVSAEQADRTVVITFKNISAAPLDISPDELSERFVRGDRSRHTDGSGLGLSIAKSLTELQGGQFTVDIDGDLFKVTVSFPMA